MNRTNSLPLNWLRRSSLLALTLLAGTALCAPALADDGLGGPKVKDESVQGQPRKLAGTPGGREAARDGAQRIPHRGFLRALLSLQKDDAPAGLRLTDAQLATIKQANEQFVDSMQSYVSANKATVEQLRSQLPARERRRVDGFLRMSDDIVSLRDLSAVTEPAKGADQPRPERKAEGANEGEQAVDEAKAREARDQLLAIVEGAPKAADAHAAMVAVLTEEQKTYVKQQGEKMREQGRGEGRGEGRMQGRGEGDGPRLTEEQREKLRNMTPEERREFLRTLREERGKDGKPGKQGKEGKAPKQEGKPAEGDDQMMDPR